MKKISLFLLMFVGLISINQNAQGQDLGSVFSESADIPVTDNNMSVVFPAGTFNDYVGYILVAFVDGVPVSNGSAVAGDGSAGVAVIGSDAMCNCDLASGGDEVYYALYDGTTLLLVNVTPPSTYAANTFLMFSDQEIVVSSGASTGCSISSADNFTAGFDVYDGSCLWSGCTDDSACNYDAIANNDDGSCLYVDGICETCEMGVIVDNDADDDGVCDADEVAGCMDASACNYDLAATDDDGSCEYTDGICETCENGVIVDNDADDDGVCDDDEIDGCMDALACNFDSAATDEDGSCVFADDACETCEAGAVSFYDADGDGYCDFGTGLSPEEILGCTVDTMFNYNASATEDDNSCIAIAIGCMNPAAVNFDENANTSDNTLCEYDGINPWGPNGGSEEEPTYITGSSMSILFQSGEGDNESLSLFNDLEAGDIIFAAYETSRLVNDYLEYSEVNGMASAGAVSWTGGQVGVPVFGAGNINDDGFEEGEDIVWLVKKASDGLIYNVQLLNNSSTNLDLSWENGEYKQVHGVVLGSLFYDGCMDPTVPNFNPLATEDDGSCATPYSIGCMDMSAVNYAGVGANPTHDNAENINDVFGQNEGYNLNTGETFPSGTAANFSDDSYCQDQIEGCTDPMAINYDPLATQNEDTVCDWTLNGMTEYDVDADGNILNIDYNFGAVDPSNENDGIQNSDFDNAQILFDAGALDPDAHVIDNLADVMEWIDADEIADSTLLANTIAAMQFSYDSNDTWWTNTYNDTLDSVAVWFAADEEADSTLLANTIAAMQFSYDSNDTWWTNTYNDTLDSVAVWFAEDEAADSTLLANTIAQMTADFNDMVAFKDSVHAALLFRVTGSETGDVEAYNIGTSYYHDGAVDTQNGIIAEMQSALDYHSSAIEINLKEQWNNIGYYLQHESSIIEQFLRNFDGQWDVDDHINIVKNNEGAFYWPEFGYDGIGQLVPGQGYQVRCKEDEGGHPTFKWDSSVAPDVLRIMNPTVPTWAIDMEIENHPNDVRTLVRVVNMLGQEVNPTEQFNGEVLLYMYNDGTVEKKMVE